MLRCARLLFAQVIILLADTEKHTQTTRGLLFLFFSGWICLYMYDAHIDMNELARQSRRRRRRGLRICIPSSTGVGPQKKTAAATKVIRIEGNIYIYKE